MSRWSEALMAVGSFELTLRADTPTSVLDAIDPYSTIAITAAPVPATTTWDGILASALFTGYVTGRPERNIFEGPSLAGHLGDADGTAGGYTAYTGSTLPFDALIPKALQGSTSQPRNPIAAGTIHDIGAPTRGGAWESTTARDALATIMAIYADYDAEWRVNPDGTLDAGTAEQLHGVATVRALISRLGAGNDPGIVGLDTTIDVDADWEDWASIIKATTSDAGYVYVYTAANPYRDHAGVPLVRCREIAYDTSSTVTASDLARAELAAGGERRSIKLTLDNYDVRTTDGTRLAVGHTVAVYDPLNGITNPDHPILFHGRYIAAQLVRIVAWDRPIRTGYGIYAQRSTGSQDVIDLTRYLEPDTGAGQLTVGSLARIWSNTARRVAAQTAADAWAALTWTSTPTTYSGSDSGTLSPGGSPAHAYNLTDGHYVASLDDTWPTNVETSAAGALCVSMGHPAASAAPGIPSFVGTFVLDVYTAVGAFVSVTYGGLYAVAGDLSRARFWTGSQPPGTPGQPDAWLSVAGPWPTGGDYLHLRCYFEFNV